MMNEVDDTIVKENHGIEKSANLNEEILLPRGGFLQCILAERWCRSVRFIVVIVDNLLTEKRTVSLQPS